MTDDGTHILGDHPHREGAGTPPAASREALPPNTGHRAPRAAAALEHHRARAVHRLALLNSDDEERFDRLTRTARTYFGVSSASISLIADDQQYLKSFIGPLHRHLDRSIALCNVTIQQDEPLIITDTLSDPRFSTNPLVLAAPFIRFYAGIPLRGPGGWFVGSFCIMDHATRDFSRHDQQKLHALANQAETELNAGLLP